MTATLLGVAAILLVGLVAALVLYACLVVGARSERRRMSNVNGQRVERHSNMSGIEIETDN